MITLLVVVHLGASAWHGSAHTELAINLSPAKNFFVYAVILIAPLVAAGLVWTRHISLGMWVLFLSMLGALLFGVYHHYMLVSPDNIGHLPTGSAGSQFRVSAGAIASLELVAALFAAFCLRARRAHPESTSSKP